MSAFQINSSSITPFIKEDETQIIFQRHCNYDKKNGILLSESINIQENIVSSFIKKIKDNFPPEELKNTYFLFDSSNTTSNNHLKRCTFTTNIAMNVIKKFFEENHISLSHIMNLNIDSNYYHKVRENSYLTEPKMFTDTTGYVEYLKEKHHGINLDFWIDFEEDLSKEKRQELGSEGPDEIVNRSIKYLRILQRYATYFHLKFPNSRLIIWCGTHYDVISPLVKQKILNYEKSDIVEVDYCGGISFRIDTLGNMTVNMNGINYPFDFQETKQLRRHF